MKTAIIGASGHYPYAVRGASKRREQMEICAVAAGTKGEDLTGLISSCEEAGFRPAVYDDWRELLEEVKKYPSEDVYIIGGESIYRQLLPYCDLAQVTKIDYEYDADAFFPNLDEDPEWQLTGESEEGTYFDLEYRFLRYERVRKA